MMRWWRRSLTKMREPGESMGAHLAKQSILVSNHLWIDLWERTFKE